MSDIDYNALRGAIGGDPPDGTHQAYLARAALVDTSSGTKLVSEWQVTGMTPYYWASWHGFAPTRMNVTQEYLDALGVDRSKITDDDAFTDELLRITGKTYTVRTSAWSGGVNTYVEETSIPAQAELTDIPVDAEPVAVGVAVGDEDDIPF